MPEKTIQLGPLLIFWLKERGKEKITRAPLPRIPHPWARLFTYSFDLRRNGSRGGGIIVAAYRRIQIQAAAGHPADWTAAGERGRAGCHIGRSAAARASSAAARAHRWRKTDCSFVARVSKVFRSFYADYWTRFGRVCGYLYGLYWAAGEWRCQVFHFFWIVKQTCWFFCEAMTDHGYVWSWAGHSRMKSGPKIAWFRPWIGRHSIRNCCWPLIMEITNRLMIRTVCVSFGTQSLRKTRRSIFSIANRRSLRHVLLGKPEWFHVLEY